MKIKNLLYLATLLLILSSCKDDDFLNKLVLDKIVYHENVDQIGQFKYNSDGKIQQYQDFFNNKQTSYIDYKYSDGSLKERDYFSTYSGGDSFIQTQSQLFSYTANGELHKAYVDDSAQDVSEIYTYTWVDGNVSKVEIASQGSSRLEKFYEMQYDANGNVVKRLFYVLEDDSFILYYILEYEYDNKINPLFALGEPIDLLTSIPNNISPNNVIKILQRVNEDKDPYAITEMEYTYNEFDLPVTKKETINLFNQLSETNTKYFYKKI